MADWLRWWPRWPSCGWRWLRTRSRLPGRWRRWRVRGADGVHDRLPAKTGAAAARGGVFSRERWRAWTGTGPAPARRATVTSRPNIRTPRISTVRQGLAVRAAVHRADAHRRRHAGRWLMAPAAPEVARARQDAVNELRPRLDLREDLAVAGEEARTGWIRSRWRPGAKLRRPCRTEGCASPWAAAGAGRGGGGPRCSSGSSAWCARTNCPRPEALSRDAAVVVFLANWLFLRRPPQGDGRGRDGRGGSAHELGLLSEVLVRLERETFQTPMLARLRNRSTPKASRRSSGSRA